MRIPLSGWKGLSSCYDKELSPILEICRVCGARYNLLDMMKLVSSQYLKADSRVKNYGKNIFNKRDAL